MGCRSYSYRGSTVEDIFAKATASQISSAKATIEDIFAKAMAIEEEVYLCATMRPDYPYKTFNDARMLYCLLMVTLAMDSNPQ